MRALAVLAIMVYHAGFSPYPGGFVTLDVFFVISGFLIGGLLLKEIDRTGTLSLVDFYRRRARRILPAATVAIVAIVAASWQWLSLVAAADAAVDGIWAGMFGANIRFALENTDYFAADEPASPFQHYWSLSVEEQFYIALPLLMVASVWWARRRTRDQQGPAYGRAVRLRLVAVLGVVTAVSFAWSVFASQASPASAYFSTFTRVWEFGVGALLAIAAPLVAGRLGPTPRNLMALTGLAMIVMACFSITTADPYPGTLALLPVLGTGLVMVAGAELDRQQPEPVVQRMLGVAPLRFIGDASYSLYLWHWPVLAIATQYVGRDLSPRGLVFAFAVIFGISFASYRYVETPFRRGIHPRLPQGLVLYPVAVTVVLAASWVSIADIQRQSDVGHGAAITVESQRQEASPGRSDRALSRDESIALVQASAQAARDEHPIPAELEPDLLDLKASVPELGECSYLKWPNEKLCRRGDVDADRTLVLIGDSHARAWIPAVEAAAERAGWATYYLVKEGCIAYEVMPWRKHKDEVAAGCVAFREWAHEQIAELRPELTVVTSRARDLVQLPDGEVTSDDELIARDLRRGVAATIERLRDHSRRVVLVGDVPGMERNPDLCLTEDGATLLGCAAEPNTRVAQMNRATRQAAEAADAPYVDVEKWFCADGLCPPVVGNVVPMRDRGHISVAYAEALSIPFARAIGMER